MNAVEPRYANNNEDYLFTLYFTNPRLTVFAKKIIVHEKIIVVGDSRYALVFLESLTAG